MDLPICGVVPQLQMEVQSTSELYRGTLVLQNEFVSLWYHPEHKLVHHQLRKVPDSESFRAMLLRGAELIEQHRADRWLSDDTNNLVVRDADAQWAESVWVPRVIRAGFHYWGIVLPKVAVGKLNMRRYAAEYRKRGVEVAAYETPEEAFAWLKAFPPASDPLGRRPKT